MNPLENLGDGCKHLAGRARGRHAYAPGEEALDYSERILGARQRSGDRLRVLSTGPSLRCKWHHHAYVHTAHSSYDPSEYTFPSKMPLGIFPIASYTVVVVVVILVLMTDKHLQPTVNAVCLEVCCRSSVDVLLALRLVCSSQLSGVV